MGQHMANPIVEHRGTTSRKALALSPVMVAVISASFLIYVSIAISIGLVLR